MLNFIRQSIDKDGLGIHEGNFLILSRLILEVVFDDPFLQLGLLLVRFFVQVFVTDENAGKESDESVNQVSYQLMHHSPESGQNGREGTIQPPQ